MDVQDLPALLADISSKDLKCRIEGVGACASFLQQHDVTQEEMAQTVKVLNSAIMDNNPRVALGSISIALALLARCDDSHANVILKLTSSIVERCGDSKANVSSAACSVLSAIMTSRIVAPALLFEKCSGGFAHKNPNVRESLLRTFAPFFVSGNSSFRASLVDAAVQVTQPPLSPNHFRAVSADAVGRDLSTGLLAFVTLPHTRCFRCRHAHSHSLSSLTTIQAHLAVGPSLRLELERRCGPVFCFWL
jgi:hypothetical protein